MIVIGIGGEPATGKSTVMKKVISQLGDGLFLKSDTLAYTLHNRYNVVVLGYYEMGVTFGGTDRLPMNVQPVAEKWMKLFSQGLHKDSVVLFEGDRLFNSSFLAYIQSLGDNNVFIVLNSKEDIKKARHAQRDNQNETWLKGRVTKIANIVKAFPVVQLDNNNPGDDDVIAHFIIRRIDEIRQEMMG